MAGICPQHSLIGDHDPWLVVVVHGWEWSVVVVVVHVCNSGPSMVGGGGPWLGVVLGTAVVVGGGPWLMVVLVHD